MNKLGEIMGNFFEESGEIKEKDWKKLAFNSFRKRYLLLQEDGEIHYTDSYNEEDIEAFANGILNILDITDSNRVKYAKQMKNEVIQWNNLELNEGR